MEERARKHHSVDKKNGKCVALAVRGEEVFEMARDYFGLTETRLKAKRGISLSLEDFL